MYDTENTRDFNELVPSILDNEPDARVLNYDSSAFIYLDLLGDNQEQGYTTLGPDGARRLAASLIIAAERVEALSASDTTPLRAVA